MYVKHLTLCVQVCKAIDRHQWDIVVSLAFSHIGTGCLYSCTSSISALKALGPWVLSAWVLSLWYPGPGFMVSWEALAGPILLIVSGPEEAKLKWYRYWGKSLQFTEFRKCSHCFHDQPLRKSKWEMHGVCGWWACSGALVTIINYIGLRGRT